MTGEPPSRAALAGDWVEADPQANSTLTIHESGFVAHELTVERIGKVSKYTGTGKWELSKGQVWQVVLVLPDGYGYSLDCKFSAGVLTLQRKFPDPDDGPGVVTLIRK